MESLWSRPCLTFVLTSILYMCLGTFNPFGNAFMLISTFFVWGVAVEVLLHWMNHSKLLIFTFLICRPLFSQPPTSSSSKDKFLQLYAFPESVRAGQAFHWAVLELVKVVQTALFIFGFFSFEDRDGLLCEKTVDGLQQWMDQIGPYLRLEVRSVLLLGRTRCHTE